MRRPETSHLPPAPDYEGAHLRHLMPSAAAALGFPRFSNRLGLPPSSIAVVILADGLGDQNLAAHTGHARFLTKAWRSTSQARTLDTGAPTTTAASLASLGTGRTPGEHGMVGYDVYAPHLGRVVNMLGQWDSEVDPLAWQPHPTVLSSVAEHGAGVLTVSRAQFRDSGLTRAALRGGEFRGADSIGARFDLAAEWVTERRTRLGRISQGSPQPLLVYLYVDEVDKTGHKYGVGSPQWLAMLESLDSAAAEFSTTLGERYGHQLSVMLSADHGMLNVSPEQRIDISGNTELLSGVTHTGGEPRLLHLYTQPGLCHQVCHTWRRAFGDRVWALTGDEAVNAGWFGPVARGIEQRIGDVVVAAKDAIAIFDTDRTGTSPLDMVGQHGSLTEAERRVPLLELTGRAFTGL